MKTAMQAIRASIKETNHPQTLTGHFWQDKKQMECFLPNGESLLCESVRTIPRNPSHFVTPDAFRAPASLIKLSTAPVWMVWMNSALHGQFHSEADAIAAITA